MIYIFQWVIDLLIDWHHPCFKKPKKWFLTFGQKLRVILSEFTIVNTWDSGVAAA